MNAQMAQMTGQIQWLQYQLIAYQALGPGPGAGGRGGGAHGGRRPRANPKARRGAQGERGDTGDGANHDKAEDGDGATANTRDGGTDGPNEINDSTTTMNLLSASSNKASLEVDEFEEGRGAHSALDDDFRAQLDWADTYER